ncbi:hypothetical protein D1007_25628 [Hordeum vulgare]|nr:hypothetical protein D1007_25628 [Hordeum vulgare]
MLKTCLRTGMDEVDVLVPDIPDEDIGAYANPPEGATIDNIPDAQVTPSVTDSKVVEPSQKEKLNPPSPMKATKGALPEDDGVVITGTGHTTPIRNVLAKHTVGDVSIKMTAGKSVLDLPNIEKLKFEELHVGYLNRLASRRDFEAGLVNMMKRRYEVLLSQRYC